MREYLGRPSKQRLNYGVRNEGGELTGVVNISSMIRAAFQNGFLGFYALSPHEGRGCMRAGLAAVVDRAFDEYGLHDRYALTVEEWGSRDRSDAC